MNIFFMSIRLSCCILFTTCLDPSGTCLYIMYLIDNTTNPVNLLSFHRVKKDDVLTQPVKINVSSSSYLFRRLFTLDCSSL